MFQEDLKKHMLQHDKTEYRCSHCGNRKKNEEELRIHVLNHFQNEKYGCNVCEKRFKRKKNLERHLVTIHFICQYCGGTSKSYEDLKRHMLIHRDLKCLLCKKVFSQKNRLKYHYQLRHGHQDFYQCTRCLQNFSKKSVLLDHIKLRHKGQSNFRCEVCAKPFLYRQLYQNHFQENHVKKVQENKLECSFCDFRTNLNVKLKWHVEKSSGVGFFCKKCQIRFECKGRFDKHMEDHEGENVWTCDFCSRSYKSDNKLTQHIYCCHKEQAGFVSSRAYPCLEMGCDKFYITKSSLARHMRKTHKVYVKRRRLPIVSSPSKIDAKTTSKGINVNDEDAISKKEKESNQIQLCALGNESENGKTSEEGSSDVSNEGVKETNQTLLNKSGGDETEKQSNSVGKGYHHMIQPLSSSIEVSVYHCEMCKKFWFTGVLQFENHMRAHVENVCVEKCNNCNVNLGTPEEAVRHYVEEHLKVEYVQ